MMTMSSVTDSVQWLLNNTPKEPFEKTCRYLQKILGKAKMETVKSTHVCEVIPVKLESHPNADSLSLCSIFDGGYTCILRTEDWQGINKAVYVPPDSLCDTTRPEFSFLASEKRLYEVEGRKVYARIKARKLRGIVSFGLCVPCSDESVLGEDYAEKLGIIHFAPEEHESLKQKGINLSGGETEPAPNCHFVHYDVDSLRRYRNLINEGEMVVCTEKADGENSRFVYHNGKQYCGSRNQWKREWTTKPNYEEIEKNLRAKLTGQIGEEEVLVKLSDIKAKIEGYRPFQSKWWIVYNQNEGVQKFCKDNPDSVLYGEIFGHTNRLNYGLDDGKIRFHAFDILKDGKFLNYDEFLSICETYKINTMPLLGRFEYDFDKVCELAEGESLIPGSNCIREGVVVRPVLERYENRVGRVCFKVVSAEYLEKAK